MGVRVGLLTDMVTCSIETMTMLLTESIQVRAKWGSLPYRGKFSVAQIAITQGTEMAQTERC